MILRHRNLRPPRLPQRDRRPAEGMGSVSTGVQANRSGGPQHQFWVSPGQMGGDHCGFARRDQFN